MKNIKNKLLSIIFLSIFCILINTFVNAKYIIKNEFYIANLNIDRTKPVIELLSIENTNVGYENYANKTHTITIKIKIIEKNIKNIFFDSEHIKVKVNDVYIDLKNMSLTKIEDLQEESIYEIKLNNIEGNGDLKVELLEGIAVDKGNLVNDFKEIDTKILIDNVSPDGELIENILDKGKVLGIINFSEKIRKIDGWKFSEDKLKAEKEFTNNISYDLPIVDYASNKAFVNINITKATYINIIYASHNSKIDWTYGYGNYDVAGSEAVKTNPKYKTEALAFNITGNIDSDFVQANAYIYTNWGEGSQARCSTSNMIYNYGYNPSKGTYKSMKSNDLVTIGDKKYFQLGGAGMNISYATDINGNNPIQPSEEFYYGISGITMKLKDYSQFSIIYQILVNGTGWITACSDGQECMYNKQKPMSAFRVALVPKSEKQYVLDTWNKDVGTYNLK